MGSILLISQTALELGFQYALVAMALFLSYRIQVLFAYSFFQEKVGQSSVVWTSATVPMSLNAV